MASAAKRTKHLRRDQPCLRQLPLPGRRVLRFSRPRRGSGFNECHPAVGHVAVESCLPFVPKVAGSGIGLGATGKLTVELGSQRHRRRDAQLGPDGNDCRIRRRRNAVDDEAGARQCLKLCKQRWVAYPIVRPARDRAASAAPRRQRSNTRNAFRTRRACQSSCGPRSPARTWSPALVRDDIPCRQRPLLG